jgi:hypothetical protein
MIEQEGRQPKQRAITETRNPNPNVLPFS